MRCNANHCAMDTLQILIVFMLPTSMDLTATQISPLEEYCEWDTFDPQCKGDEVVLVEEAIYGRMRTGTCIKDNRDIGCHYDVTSIAHQKCSGRRSCEITIPDRDFDSTQPCGEMKNYLQIRNTCVKVEQGTGSTSCRSCDYITVSGSTGHISSAVTQENGCGDADCPWLIEAGKGQRIHVTIYDFSVSSSSSHSSTSLSPTCVVYAVLKEVKSRTSTTVCGGKEYKQELEVTENQSLEVRVIIGQAARIDSAQFLLHYQVIGCADLDDIDGADIVRNKGVSTVTCRHNSDQTWRLTCNSTSGEWNGEHGNCLKAGEEVDTKSQGTSKFPYGVSLVLILSIAVVVGLFILMIGICYFKRNNQSLKDRLRREIPPATADEAVYAEYGHNMDPRDPRLDMQQQQQLQQHHPVDIDPSNRKLYQTYGPAQGMRNEYTHIWERPLPQPSNSLNRYPQAI